MNYRFFILLALIFSLSISQLTAQHLYTAQGYWEEFQKKNYQQILLKRSNRESLTKEEVNFIEDYTQYLDNYYARLSDAEKEKVDDMLLDWEFQRGNENVLVAQETDFDLRTRDRLINGVYGFYYGLSLAALFEVEDAGVGIGLPLIMAGAWQLGPVLNKKKYEHISLATIRAGNTGKFLGAGYGAALGAAIAGDSDNDYKWILGLSTLGSISLGELAFQGQKKKNLSLGTVEMMRLYGFLGPIVTGFGSLAIDPNNVQLFGGAIVVGGVGGLLLGKNAAKKYDYSQGDVDVVSSLMIISAGLGATIAIGTIEENSNTGLLLIPAATAIAGTAFGQKSVKGVHLTKRQGSTIQLASGGAALIGLGVVALTEAEDPAWYVGTASVSALFMHQVLFSSYKKKNFEKNLNLGKNDESWIKFTMKVTPENYFAHKNMSEKQFMANPDLTYPIVNFKLTF